MKELIAELNQELKVAKIIKVKARIHRILEDKDTELSPSIKNLLTKIEQQINDDISDSDLTSINLRLMCDF